MCIRDTDLDTGNNHSSVLMGRFIDCFYSFVFSVVTLEPTLCESSVHGTTLLMELLPCFQQEGK